MDQRIDGADRKAREKKLFRAWATEAIKNSHATIKACWMILFAGGTFALLNSSDHIVDCKIVGRSSFFDCKTLDSHFSIYAGLVAVYIGTFYRFYVGNIRLFDIRYDEALKFIPNLVKDPPSTADRQSYEDQEFDWLFRYNNQWNKAEIPILIIKTLVIIYLTVAIISPLKFEITYLILLGLDIAWMILRQAEEWAIFRRPKLPVRYRFEDKLAQCFEKLQNRTISEKALQEFDMAFPRTPLKVWQRNNSYCGAGLVICLAIIIMADRNGVQFFGVVRSVDIKEFFLAVNVIIMLLNCIFDLALTWKFYNPQFKHLNSDLFGKDT